jgi:ABC-type branched-subunit amino acid transport system substrate-binding protein
MLRRAFILLAAGLPVAGCVTSAPPIYPQPPTILTQPAAAPNPPAGPPVHPIGVLLPMTGSNAELAGTLLNAVRLALDVPGAPPLDVRDTTGTPAGAATAAQQAVAAGDQMIIGPLTSPETAAAAPAAMHAGVPMLAFTSDPAQAQPGVWVLGITPLQQVRRLVAAAEAQSRSRFAAILPRNPFGDALAEALTEVLSDSSGLPPDIRRYTGDFADLTAQLKDLSQYDQRRGALPPGQVPDAPRAAAPADAVPPAPFDALLVANAGSGLTGLASLLQYDDVGLPGVRVLGPGLWATLPPDQLAPMAGAWFAAPDPAARQPFVQAYAAKYGGPPPPLDDLAFDAASIARVLAAAPGGISAAALTQPTGFSGADGVLGLLPDGHARRGLAVFEVNPGGGTHIADPAPTSLPAPGTPVPGA